MILYVSRVSLYQSRIILNDSRASLYEPRTIFWDSRVSFCESGITLHATTHERASTNNTSRLKGESLQPQVNIYENVTFPVKS
jgi:hypothetical protein